MFFDWLLTQEGMRQRTAHRVIDSGLGGLAEFQADLLRANATAGVSSPVYFVVSSWLEGQRVPEPPPAAAPSRRPMYRRGSQHLAPPARAHVPYLPPDVADMQFEGVGHVS